jgi:homocysteine S-methyltransferase
MYPATPEYFGDYAMAFMEAGARVIGGCCGTTPAHIAAMRQVLDSGAPGHRVLEQVDSGMPHEELVSPSDQPTVMAQKLAAGQFVMAVEMDPPRGLSTHKLLAGASLLEEAGADVINVADSPMARMRMSPWAVCNLIQQRVGLETTLHFPTRGRNLLRVQGDLLAAHALGIRNVFVVMGDPTSIGDYPNALDDYDVVPSGLIKLIKQGFNAGVDHAGSDIGQPTAFFVGGALNLTPQDPEREMKVLRRKVRAGVDFLLTQPVYDADAAYEFVTRYETAYGKLEIPILVGILSLYSARHAAFLHNEVPGITIPEAIHTRLARAGDDAKYEGVRIAQALIAQMRGLDEASGWIAGVYLMPAFNRYDLAAEIVEACPTT